MSAVGAGTVTTNSQLASPIPVQPVGLQINTTAPTITGTVAGQTTTSEAPVHPFAGVTISDLNNGATDTLTITLSNGGTTGTLSGQGLSGGNNGVYTLAAASAATITQELDALVFTPSTGTPGSSTTTTFTLDDLSSADPTPTVSSSTTVISTGSAAAPTISGALAGQTTTSETQVKPFVGVTIADSNSGATDTLTITLSNGGTTGALSGQGLASNGEGVYTLTGTAATITSELQGLVFTPAAEPPNTRTTTTFTLSDSSSAFATATVNDTTTVIDTVGAVAPTVTAGATATFTGGGGPVLLDAALTVSDPSSATLASATVSIGAGFLAGDTLNFTNQNGITGSYNAATGVLTLTGSTSMANYQAALNSITYSFTPTNGDPTDTTRTISWVVNDGVTSSAAVTSTLDTVHVAPTVVAGATVSYEIGGAAVVLDSALTVSDVDSGGILAGATVAIGAGFAVGDTLNFTNQNGITGSYNAATGVLTLTGSTSVANYQTALNSITFSSTVESAGSRTIDWTVTDGSASQGTSATATSTVDTTHVAPTVVAGATATFTGGGGPVLLDAALTVSDPSSATLASATVSIGTGFLAGDTLNFTNQNGITGSYNAATGVLTLTGSASVANYQAALNSITYSFTPTNGDPTDTTRTISWVVNDGVTSSAAVTSTLDTVHVAPTVVAGATVSYEIGGAAVVLDSALTVSDVDSGGVLAGATVAIGAGFAVGDTLNFTNQNGITGSYNAATGVLTLTGSTSVANYQTALNSITYSSTVESAGSRTIDWTVTDGSTSHGTSATATSTVDTTHVAPTVVAGATATFTGGGGPVLLDAALTVSDPSSATLASATVSIGAGFLAGDTLNFTNQNGITGSYNAATGVLTLTGSTSVANYQAALNSITYSFTPTNGDPTDTTRTISWVVNDGVTSSAAVTSTLDTVHVAPTVVAGATVSYEIGGAAVVLDSALTVSDVDSGGVLAGATVAIGAGFAVGDTLNFTNQNGITGSYNAATGVLTLTGSTSVANYQTALELHHLQLDR